MIPSRLSQIGESATIKTLDVIKRLEKSGINVISLSTGEPDFPTPEHICQAALKAMREGKTHYTPSAGIPELREAIARKLREENGIDAKPSNVIVTPGAKHAIYEACASLLDRGDEAILFDPAWISFPACVRLCEASIRWVSGVEELEDAIGDRTRLIVINSPNNPSGRMMGRDELEQIAEVARRKNVYVLSDEIYEKIVYEKEHISIASLDGMADRTIVINGFSKTYAMTGWRIGYAYAPPDVIRRMNIIQQHTVTCAPSFVQYASLAAMEGPQDCVRQMVDEFRRRRNVLVDGLRAMGFECEKPDGAFYLWLNVSGYGGGERFAGELLEKAGVAVTSGTDFGPSGKDYIRISYAASMERIEEALGRIENIIRGSV